MEAACAQFQSSVVALLSLLSSLLTSTKITETPSSSTFSSSSINTTLFQISDILRRLSANPSLSLFRTTDASLFVHFLFLFSSFFMIFRLSSLVSVMDMCASQGYEDTLNAALEAHLALLSSSPLLLQAFETMTFQTAISYSYRFNTRYCSFSFSVGASLNGYEVLAALLSRTLSPPSVAILEDLFSLCNFNHRLTAITSTLQFPVYSLSLL